MLVRCILHSLDESQRLGRALGRAAQPGDVICLDGDLGAGKTTLTQQIAIGLDVPADCYVTSPSFAIMHEYLGGKLPIYHMDFYRLHSSDDVLELGFDEYFYQQGITLIEWANRAEDVLPEKRLSLLFSLRADEEREILFRCGGEGWRVRLQRILKEGGLECDSETD